MTVSAGAQAEIRAEKVTLLPVGANAGITSAILSLLLPGDLVVTQQGITGIKHEGVTMHYTCPLPAALEPALLRMRDVMTSLLNEEFVVTTAERSLAPLLLQLMRPLLRDRRRAYPSTDPVGFVRRPKLNLLPSDHRCRCSNRSPRIRASRPAAACVLAACMHSALTEATEHRGVPASGG